MSRTVCYWYLVKWLELHLLWNNENGGWDFHVGSSRRHAVFPPPKSLKWLIQNSRSCWAVRISISSFSNWAQRAGMDVRYTRLEGRIRLGLWLASRFCCCLSAATIFKRRVFSQLLWWSTRLAAPLDRHDISKIKAIVNVSAHAEEVGRRWYCIVGCHKATCAWPWTSVLCEVTWQFFELTWRLLWFITRLCMLN